MQTRPFSVCRVLNAKSLSLTLTSRYQGVQENIIDIYHVIFYHDNYHDILVEKIMLYVSENIKLDFYVN